MLAVEPMHHRTGVGTAPLADTYIAAAPAAPPAARRDVEVQADSMQHVSS